MPPATKPFQVRIEPDLLAALQEVAPPRSPGLQGGAGALLRRLAALFVDRVEDDDELEGATSFLRSAEADEAAGEDWGEPFEAERFKDDLLRFATRRTTDSFARFKALSLVGRLDLLLYKRARAAE